MAAAQDKEEGTDGAVLTLRHAASTGSAMCLQNQSPAVVCVRVATARSAFGLNVATALLQPKPHEPKVVPAPWHLLESDAFDNARINIQMPVQH